MTRPMFKIRQPIFRDLPEVRRVGWNTDAGYDAAEFCDVAMSDRVTALFKSMGGRDRLDDPEEARLDFIVKMLETQWWRRWVPSRGNLEGFVVRFAVIYMLDRRCRGERTRQRRRRRHTESHRRQALNPTHHQGTVDEAREIVEKLARRADPEAVEAMDTVLAAGGDLPMAAHRLQIDVSELRARLARVRFAAKETGVDVKLRSTAPRMVPV